MDLVLKGRGVRISDQIRRTAEHKLGKIARLDPRATRLEIEITQEHNPRIGASHRVQVAWASRRRTFRAEGSGPDIDSALDQVSDRLERQITSYRGKLRNRLFRRANRLESPRTSPEESGSSE
jgi:ribosomal subunit interface protein